MRREDDQELWDILDRAASPPRLSEFFARNVVRQIRQESHLSQSPDWFSWRRLVSAGAVASLLIGATLAIQHPFSKRFAATDNAPDVVAQIDPQDFEVVADLDVLIASDETNLWDENQSL